MEEKKYITSSSCRFSKVIKIMTTHFQRAQHELKVDKRKETHPKHIKSKTENTRQEDT